VKQGCAGQTTEARLFGEPQSAADMLNVVEAKYGRTSEPRPVKSPLSLMLLGRAIEKVGQEKGNLVLQAQGKKAETQAREAYSKKHR
jgi:hypothetical protein